MIKIIVMFWRFRKDSSRLNFYFLRGSQESMNFSVYLHPPSLLSFNCTFLVYCAKFLALAIASSVAQHKTNKFPQVAADIFPLSQSEHSKVLAQKFHFLSTLLWPMRGLSCLPCAENSWYDKENFLPRFTLSEAVAAGGPAQLYPQNQLMNSCCESYQFSVGMCTCVTSSELSRWTAAGNQTKKGDCDLYWGGGCVWWLLWLKSNQSQHLLSDEDFN
jgi:hypothetical protein